MTGGGPPRHAGGDATCQVRVVPPVASDLRVLDPAVEAARQRQRAARPRASAERSGPVR